MNAAKPFAALRRLDYLPAWLAVTLGVSAGVLLSLLLFQASPLMAGVGFVALLGGRSRWPGAGSRLRYLSSRWSPFHHRRSSWLTFPTALF